MDDVWSFFKLFVDGVYSGFGDETYPSVGFLLGAKTFTLPKESVHFLLLRTTNLYEFFSFSNCLYSKLYGFV